MNKKAINNLRRDLANQDLTLSLFSENHDFCKMYVYQVVKRYWGNKEKYPNGIKAIRILDTLKTYSTPPEAADVN